MSVLPTSAATITTTGSAFELQTSGKDKDGVGLRLYYRVKIASFVHMICTDDEATLWASKTPARSTLNVRPQVVPSTAFLVSQALEVEEDVGINALLKQNN
jgi:hypothetical protein